MHKLEVGTTSRVLGRNPIGGAFCTKERKELHPGFWVETQNKETIWKTKSQFVGYY